MFFGGNSKKGHQILGRKILLENHECQYLLAMQPAILRDFSKDHVERISIVLLNYQGYGFRFHRLCFLVWRCATHQRFILLRQKFLISKLWLNESETKHLDELLKVEKASKVVVLILEDGALHVVDEVKFIVFVLVLHHLKLQIIESFIYCLLLIISAYALFLWLMPIAKQQVSKLQHVVWKHTLAIWFLEQVVQTIVEDLWK